MKRLIALSAKCVAAFAFVATIVSINTTCTCFAHQPEVPEEAMKLKKW